MEACGEVSNQSFELHHEFTHAWRFFAKKGVSGCNARIEDIKEAKWWRDELVGSMEILEPPCDSDEPYSEEAREEFSL